MLKGAEWFYWIAGFSLVNSVLALVGIQIAFLAGLAVVQIADVVAAKIGLFAPFLGLTIDIAIAACVCVFGHFAARGSRVALIIGMSLYALDGIIFLLLSAYLPAAFHAFVLYRMWQGWKTHTQRDRLLPE